jgi:hypothetical protein
MIPLTVPKLQWVFDTLFGVVLLVPLFGYGVGLLSDPFLYVGIGVGIGYVLHISQKMLAFDRMLSEEIREQASEQVESEVSDRKEQVEEELDSQIEDKVDEKVKQAEIDS